MTAKIRKRFVDHGYGFPVILHNVKMTRIRGTWTPDIDYNRLALAVLASLVRKKSPLTGSELRFIRHHFRMTLKAFAKRFGVTHPAVVKWENAKDKPSRASWSTEKDIRLFVALHLKGEPADFVKTYRLLTPIAVSPRQSPPSVTLRRGHLMPQAFRRPGGVSNLAGGQSVVSA